MLRHVCQWLWNERGSVLLFTTTMLVLLLLMGGFAIDLLYQTTADNELQRTMDFAALAGAGKLGFDSTGLTNARNAARAYGIANPIHNPNGGTITLDLNDANDPNGNIVLGVWDGTTFTRGVPPLNPTEINAVKCQFQTSVPSSFLRLLGSGFFNLPVGAFSIAWSPPPAIPPPASCTLPIAVTDCAFRTGEGGFNSVGCGSAITFISSSTQGPGAAPGSSNTGAWTNLFGQNPTPNNTQDAINAAANGTCSTPVPTGTPIPTNNCMAQPTFDLLMSAFITKYNASGTVTVTNSPSTGDPQTTYTGKGWQMYIPVIATGGTCPPGPINGTNTITGWTQFTMTQVINLSSQMGKAGGYGSNGRCAVPNDADSNSWPYCNDPNLHSAFRGVFGYYSCQVLDTIPSVAPGPRTSIAEKLKLVK